MFFSSKNVYIKNVCYRENILISATHLNMNFVIYLSLHLNRDCKTELTKFIKLNNIIF